MKHNAEKQGGHMSHRGDGRGDGHVINVHSEAGREHQQEFSPLRSRSVAASLKYPAGACVPDYAGGRDFN